jgi:cellulose synthase/poly-beta-1,6-N-acetylglucosamine synthase-like glycosyltransferase
MSYFLTTLFILTLIYAGFILWCEAGWRKLKIVSPEVRNFQTLVTIVIPARNEEQNIENCLRDILAQEYPYSYVEVIVVDDDSDDTTPGIVTRIMNEYPGRKIKLIKNQGKETGLLFKKMAITKAVLMAEGELIVTTDADCRMSENWLAALVSCYEKEKPLMIAGPVCFHHEKNFFEKLQILEFSGLIGIGAGAIAHGFPLLCNGANLAYTKKIFLEVQGFSGSQSVASGDDTQLMLKIAAQNRSGIRFLKSKDAIVYTSARNSWNELFRQRKRWASKIPVSMNSFTVFIACIAYLLHLGLFILFIDSIFHPSIGIFFLGCMLVKVIPEFILLRDVNSFFNRIGLEWLLVPAQLIYMIYIIIMGAVSPFGSYSWKGRKVKNTLPQTG